MQVSCSWVAPDQLRSITLAFGRRPHQDEPPTPQPNQTKQVSAALSTSTAGSASLHAAVLDYCRDLGSVTLTRLRPPRRARLARAAIRAAGLALIGWGLTRGAAAALPALVAAARGARGRGGNGWGLLPFGDAGGSLTSSLTSAGGAVLAPVGALVSSVVAPSADHKTTAVAAEAGQQVTSKAPARPGPIRWAGRAVGRGAMAAAGAVGRPVARFLRNRVSDRAREAVSASLGAF
jgi:hypothetical protein